MRNPEKQEISNKNGAEVEKVLGEIAKAAGNALPIDEFEDRQERIDLAAKKMRVGKKLSREELILFSQESLPNEASFPSFEIMREAFLRIGLSQDLINEIVEHEKAHFDAAKEKGLSATIIIKFYRLKNGTIQFLPAVKTGFIEGRADTPESIEDVAGAPATPSPSDLNKIK